ncbi:MAG: DUF2950 family protein [Spirochaetales bacterium]|nr:DUF2950 family protein [Spirochaetales bacterium]
MISFKWPFLIISGFFGLALQLSALLLFFTAPGNEVILIISLLLYYTGSCCMMTGFEYRVRQENRNRWTVILVFAGIIGYILFLFIKTGNKTVQNVYKEKEKKPALPDRITAFIFLLLAVICFAWVVSKWPYTAEQTGRTVSPHTIQTNESAAYKMIKQIIRAQDEYHSVDYNNNGKLEYALFPVHLWTTVDEKANPLFLGLLPGDIASAMGPSLAVKGYYFNFLHVKECPPWLPVVNEELGMYYGYKNLEEIDYASEWVLTAQPAHYGKSGKLSFIAHSSGQIWGKDVMYAQIIKWFPFSLSLDGWKVIREDEDITDL